MTLFIRLFVIAFAFLAACFVTGALVLMTWLLPEIFDSAFAPLDQPSMAVVLAAGMFAVSGLALIPVGLMIVLFEIFSIRNALIYALSGAVAGLSAYLAFIDFDTAREAFGGVVRRHLEIATGAGIAGGFVYWLIAGRNAGRWREFCASTLATACGCQMNRTGLLIALGLSLVTGLVFGFFPELDLKVAALFYDATAKAFPYSQSALLEFLRNAAMVIAWAFALPSILAIVGKLIWPNLPMFVSGRKALFLAVTMILAAGIITNLGFKSHWGRPRPVAVTEFNGQWQFKPFWDSSGECPKNCSFFSGEGATAFWTYAPASLAPPQWRPLAYGAATIFGVLTGSLRVMFGGHFLTDVIISGLVTFLVIWLLHGLIFRWRRTRLTDEGVDAALTRLGWPGYAWRQRFFAGRRPAKPPLAHRIIGTHDDD